MYRKDSDGWLKHADFMLLDMICLQLSFVLAYALRGMEMDLYSDVLYRNMAVFLCLADLVVIFTAGTMKSVLKRGMHLLELDALGGHGSRGYGKIKFENVKYDGADFDVEEDQN